jgi:hypothetical protein
MYYLTCKTIDGSFIEFEDESLTVVQDYLYNNISEDFIRWISLDDDEVVLASTYLDIMMCGG